MAVFTVALANPDATLVDLDNPESIAANLRAIKPGWLLVEQKSAGRDLTQDLTRGREQLGRHVFRDAWPDPNRCRYQLLRAFHVLPQPVC